MEMGRSDVELAPLSEHDFQLYKERLVQEYASQSVAAGRVEETEAMDWSRRETEKFLPDGLHTRNALLFKIVPTDSRSTTVGYIWCGTDPGNAKNAFIYDLFIYPEHRRRGYATRALRKLEVLAREEGYNAVALHVYAHNIAATELYGNLGYEATSSVLRKKL